MKKIDLHIHTIAVGGKDSDFEFSLGKLIEYVETFAIDAIAITNHNLFDLNQFNSIKGELIKKNVTVLPGIEIDLNGGHLLLIDNGDDLDDFNSKCVLVSTEVSKLGQIDTKKLIEIFVDLKKYLVIPHYRKKPNIDSSTIASFGDTIFSGEVQSPKKFSRVLKEENSLAPVLFSDLRISKNLNLEECGGRFIFIKTESENLSFDVIRAVLRDKNKIFLSNNGKHNFFQVFKDGQVLSNGLNIVLGKRSSGKTNLLNRLKNIFDNDGRRVKYIEQFSLVNNDEKKFDETVEMEKSSTREDYLKDFKYVVEDVIDIDWKNIDYKIGRYVDTLIDFASNEKMRDEFSNSALYTENLFITQDDEDLKRVIRSVKTLIDEKDYKAFIDKYISEVDLNLLLKDLEIEYKKKIKLKLKKDWVNSIVIDVKSRLQKNTSSQRIEFNEEINLYEIKIKREKVKKFTLIVKSLKNERVIHEDKSFDKFKIQSIAGAYVSTGEMHNESGKKVSFLNAFKKYNRPFIFLQELKNTNGLERAELYRYFCKVTCKVLNEYDKKVSGGERAEFNLLKALQDALQYEMLLIDEPESSFDNIFLKDNVNKEIKNISKEMPVVVVTHNNTVGMLMEPEYIIYTQREIISNKDEYKIFSAFPGDKEFKTADGLGSLDSYEILLSTLEAGSDAYKTREILYNNFKKK